MAYEKNGNNAVIVLADQLSKLYPDLNLFDKNAYFEETVIRKPAGSDIPLLNRLVNCRAISIRTVEILEDILADSSFEAPDLFVQAGKGYFAKNKNYSPEEKQNMYNKMEQALKEQAELRRLGKYVPRIGELLKQKGFSLLDIEIISALQLADFLRKNPKAAAKVKQRFKSSGDYFKGFRLLDVNPAKNKMVAGALAGVLAFGGIVYLSTRPKPPELSYEKLPQYYSSVLSGIQFKEIDDPELTVLRAQIKLTYDCINALEGKELDKRERIKTDEIKRKLGLIEANLDKVKGMQPKDLLIMKLSEIEKLLTENGKK